MQAFLLCLPEAHSTCESQTPAPRYGMPMNRHTLALKQESSYPLVPVHPFISSRTLLAVVSDSVFVPTSNKPVQTGLFVHSAR